jgi:hypothetical protein
MADSPQPPAPDFWKRKLAAFLHDPPSKALDIRLHEEHARILYRQAGLTDEEELRRLDVNFAKPSDWTASSADRLPFPKSRGNLFSEFDGVRARFHQPDFPIRHSSCYAPIVIGPMASRFLQASARASHRGNRTSVAWPVSYPSPLC